MNLLITGADGFIGRNLRAALRQFDHRLFLIDVQSSDGELTDAAANADFVFHLAGVNRPKTKRNSGRATPILPRSCWGCWKTASVPPC